MKILLTADPAIPVPPVGYGGIERIVDALARHYRSHGHEVGLVSHPESTCSVDARFSWHLTSGRLGDARNAWVLLKSARSFAPEVIHSFSRLGYMLPVLAKAVPKVMSYQRHTGGRQIALAARIAGRSLMFTGCSEFISAMGRRAGGTWKTVFNFVEPERIKFVAHVSHDAPLLFLSRIESIKGPDIAIEIAKASGRRLILAGNRAETGLERVFWDTQIQPKLGRDGIEWIGEVNDAQKDELLGRSAALVVPIQWDEPFGIVFAEALAAGTPVITCARGAAPEIIEPGRTGFFISNSDEGAKAIGQIGALDRAACRNSVVDRFSCDVCARQYLALYSGLLA